MGKRKPRNVRNFVHLAGTSLSLLIVSACPFLVQKGVYGGEGKGNLDVDNMPNILQNKTSACKCGENVNLEHVYAKTICLKSLVCY